MEKIAEAVAFRAGMSVGSKNTPLNIQSVMDIVRNLPGMVVRSDLWWKANMSLTKNNSDDVEEVLIGHGVGNRMIQERFQHSGETVSIHFHKVLLACLKLAMDIIKPKDPALSDVHTKLRDDKTYWPYFRNCIGAINGTHVACIVPSKDQIKYICRKGFTSQNVMTVCDRDTCFTFVWPGWEGIAFDARIFDQALGRQDLNFPHPLAGNYYLVDSGYPTMLGYLGPYKGECYHLSDFGRNSSFRNPNEIFNFFHSSLRCTIERTFGVWKNRFSILRSMPSFKFHTQVHLVTTTMAIHNFIRRNSSTEAEFDHYANEDIMPKLEEEDGHSGSHL
ncbi:uncharacterized protein LOC132629037 [Lycium barbarum]|uniref:uncharacterized protein LOC132629037 n=1 Tax=Lycium barbarum TaxID=112863 RepID=UPI00293E2E1F|nr:uncharacterized protein LOC132629037 [Lycium barbarum]